MASETAEQRVVVPLLRASWDTVTFVHWPVGPARIQELLPPGLQVDVYDGAAWVGLLPFVMANMRPLSLRNPIARASGPTLRRMVDQVSSTPEANLRTYVRGPDGRDGLWFLTLDIGSGFLAAALRAGVGAPYHKAELTVEQDGATVRYTGSRVGGRVGYRLQVQPGRRIAPSDFDVWLTGRWRAYTRHLGQLFVTPVEHEAWPLREATLDYIEQDVTDSIGLSGLTAQPMVHYSDGVHRVRLGPPELQRGR